MSKSDQWVITTISILILLHLAILSIGYFTSRFTYLPALLNLAIGAFVILYWTIRQLQIKQHYIETREVIVLLAEALVISGAIFYMATNQKNNWVKVMQWVIFGIHLCVLLLGLAFMLTFKMKKLI